jgi:hypothetical protein
MEQVKPFTTVHGTSQTIYNSEQDKPSTTLHGTTQTIYNSEQVKPFTTLHGTSQTITVVYGLTCSMYCFIWLVLFHVLLYMV